MKGWKSGAGTRSKQGDGSVGGSRVIDPHRARKGMAVHLKVQFKIQPYKIICIECKKLEAINGKHCEECNEQL